MAINIDLYNVLKLDPRATQDEIRRAYHNLALKYHPDKQGGIEDSTKFTEIKNAYDILSDPVQRSIYDNNKSTVEPITGWKDFMGDVMSSMYTLFQMYIVPKTINIEVECTLDEVYNRKVKKIEVRVRRWSQATDSHFGEDIQIVYVPLNNYKKEYIYTGQGDDSIIKSKPRSDIIITLTIKSPSGVYIEETLGNFDLYVNKDISLYDFYVSKIFRFQIYDSFILTFDNEKKYSYTLAKKGLPFIDTDTGEQSRGNVYVKLNVILPTDIEVTRDLCFFLYTYFSEPNQ